MENNCIICYDDDITLSFQQLCLICKYKYCKNCSIKLLNKCSICNRINSKEINDFIERDYLQQHFFYNTYTVIFFYNLFGLYAFSMFIFLVYYHNFL